MTPELALQKAIRGVLISQETLTDLVPASSILDRNERPAPDPAIIIGEGQSVDEGNSIGRTLTRVYMDVHVWKREPSTVGVKLIAGAIRKALSLKLEGNSGFHFADCFVQGVRFLRDPDGVTSHAVVTLNALVQEMA
jgi:hypothetical protein